MTRALALGLAVAAGACGTSRVVASDPFAAIYIDGALAGHGSAELRKRGTPSSVDIDVRYPDGTRSRRVVARKFTAVTLIAGMFTYGVGLFTVWELPDEIAVPAPPRVAGGWDGAAEDPWMRPPSAAVKSSAW